MNSFNFGGQNADPEIVRENFNKIARYLTAADACVLSLQSESANISALGANAAIRNFTVFMRSDTDVCDVTIPDPAIFDYSVIGKKDTLFFFKGLSGASIKTVNINAGTVEGAASFTLANDQTVCIQSDGVEYKILFDSTAGGGGGGDDTNFAEDNLTFDSDRTHDLNGFALNIMSTGYPTSLLISPALFSIDIVVGDTAFSSSLKLIGDGGGSNVYFSLKAIDDLSEVVEIKGNAITQGIDYAAISHTFHQQLIFSNYTGAGTYVGTPVKGLAVTAAGELIEVDTISGASNGLSVDGQNIVLGGNPLDRDTVIDNDGHTLTVSDNGTNTLLFVTNAGTGSAINASSAGSGAPAIIGTSSGGGSGVKGIEAGNNGFAIVAEGSSTTGTGLYVHTTGANSTGLLISSFGDAPGIPLNVTHSSTFNHAVVPIMQIVRLSTTTAANGIGCSIDFNIGQDNGSFDIANQIVASWLNATPLTRLSKFAITGSDASNPIEAFSITGFDRFQSTLLPNYANDAAAAAGTPVVPVGGWYRNGSVQMQRVT